MIPTSEPSDVPSVTPTAMTSYPTTNEPSQAPSLSTTEYPTTASNFIYSVFLRLDAVFSELESYWSANSITCSDWATPIIRSAIKLDAYKVVIKVNKCSEGSIVIDYDMEYPNEDVLKLAVENVQATTTIEDTVRGETLPVLESGQIATNAPSVSPTTDVASDANTNESSSMGIGVILIIVFIVLFLVIAILLVVVLKRGKSKKDFQKSQRNIQLDQVGSATEMHSTDVNSKDNMLDTDVVEAVIPGNDMLDSLDNNKDDAMYYNMETNGDDHDMAVKSQQQVLDEILEGNSSTKGAV